MTTTDNEYFARRARQEDRAARQATCIEARICHQKLADAYRSRCNEIIDTSTPIGRFKVATDYPIKRRQPIVSSNTSMLAASPSAALRPFCRA